MLTIKLLPHQMQMFLFLTDSSNLVYSSLDFAYLYHYGFLIFLTLNNKCTYYYVFTNHTVPSEGINCLLIGLGM